MFSYWLKSHKRGQNQLISEWIPGKKALTHLCSTNRFPFKLPCVGSWTKGEIGQEITGPFKYFSFEDLNSPNLPSLQTQHDWWDKYNVTGSVRGKHSIKASITRNLGGVCKYLHTIKHCHKHLHCYTMHTLVTNSQLEQSD